MQAGGASKNVPQKNCTLIAQGMIELSTNNGFPTQRGKKLQLETLDLDSRLI